MSIEPLKKITVITQFSKKAELLNQLQAFGCLHLIDMNVNVSKDQSGITDSNKADRSQHVQQAITYLNAVANKRKAVPLSHEQDLDELVDEILENQRAKHEAGDLRDELLGRREDLKPWGSFHLPKAAAIGGNQLWLYLLPQKHKKLLPNLSLPWKVIHSDHQHVWLCVISPTEPPVTLLPVKHINTDQRSYSEICEQLLEVEIQLESLEAQRQGYTRYLNHLIQGRNGFVDESVFQAALDLGLDRDQLFIQRAWLAQSQIDGMRQLSEAEGFVLYVEDIDPSDAPPTLLKNTPALEGGELLVDFYQVPAYSSWDPSFMLFASFSLFFAMILSDAGYALLLILSLTAFSGKLRRTDTGRKLLPLLATVSFSSLLWGVLVGSYFGFEPSNALLKHLHILDINNFDYMMALSIGCGIAHLMLANIFQMLNGWGSYRATQHVGWLVSLIGASVLGFSQEGTTLNNISPFILLVGLGVVFVNGSDRPVDSSLSLVWRILDGLKALSNVTNLFGDVLSYLRLFALGLASASLALTFNQLADDAFHSNSGFSLIFGLLILLVGHGLNLVLGIVSGVVHGLRLNYIEFYKWALYGEGYPFKAFKKIGVIK